MLANADQVRDNMQPMSATPHTQSQLLILKQHSSNAYAVQSGGSKPQKEVRITAREDDKRPESWENRQGGNELW